VILLLVADLAAGGWFVRGYDRDGRMTAETWHGGLPDARRWADSEFGGGAIGAWREVPDVASDPVRFALSRRR
jgi:hypothetical protein